MCRTETNLMKQIQSLLKSKYLSLFLLINIISFLFTACKQQTLAPIHNESSFHQFAKEILTQQDAGKKIAIRPFTAKNSPIPIDDANRFNASLEQSIREVFPDLFKFVPRQRLQQILIDAEEFGQITNFNHYIEKQKADILIFGELELIGNQVLLTFRSANPQTGSSLKITASREMPYALPKATGMEFHTSLKLSAEQLLSQLSAQEDAVIFINKAGIFFENSHTQTGLGHYMAAQLNSLIQNQLIKSHKISASNYLKQEKGVSIKQKPYILTGQYWLFSDHIELRTQLKGKNNSRSFHYQVNITNNSIPQNLLSLARPNIPKRKKFNNLGPNPLFISSDRGKKPIYKIGEQLKLVVKASDTGYLFCFNSYYRGSKAVITRIFPNRYNPNALIHPHQILHIPDENMDFVFTLYPPAGSELVDCYLFDRDITNSLPQDIVQHDLVPLQINSIDDLDRIMRGIPDVVINQANLTLTVEEKEKTF